MQVIQLREKVHQMLTDSRQAVYYHKYEAYLKR